MPAREELSIRLERRTAQQGECVVWEGAISSSGYGVIGTGVGKAVNYVHRVAYIMANGSIPAGMDIDHLCRNRLCVRATHLEAVTPAENRRRANRVRWGVKS